MIEVVYLVFNEGYSATAASLTRNARERELLIERAAACARGSART